MKHSFIIILSIIQFLSSYAQPDSIFHHGTFKKEKGKFIKSSNPYKPESWEKPYYENSLKSVFPSDLIKHADKYSGKMIQLIGIIDSVYIDSNVNTVFRLENKFWDYIEDNSIQDEKMFISEKGDGLFLVKIPGTTAETADFLKKLQTDKKLFLVYGEFLELSHSIPVLLAKQTRYFDYEFYTTKVFSYEVERDKKGEVVTDKRGNPRLTNFTFFKIATAGQNK